MDWQKIIETSIALLFPLIIVFLFVYYMLKSFFDQFEKQRKQELLIKFSEETIPLRLQAYERIILFLERIKPESMVMRLAQQNMNTVDLQRSLLENIREEFEHNLSQQIYVSQEAWAMVSAARQSIVKLVSTTAIDLNPEQEYMEYATDLLEEFASISDDPLTLAIQYLQKEVKEIL
ncbi:MAG: hypothetical protein PF541_07130 [Prolixibacteraceae bacterium]|jgi:hypothetical protein|nr:hypothetical protein [Prolixibacteraceae bacterium]